MDLNIRISSTYIHFEVLGGGVPERAEEHVGSGVHNPARQVLRAGPPVPAGRQLLAEITLPPPVLRSRGRGLQIHL